MPTGFPKLSPAKDDRTQARRQQQKSRAGPLVESPRADYPSVKKSDNPDSQIIRAANTVTLLIYAIGLVAVTAIGTGYMVWLAIKAVFAG